MTLPHLDAAYNLARWLLRDEDAADDVVQEAFVRALRYFGSFRGDDPKPWLLGIVRNSCFTWLRDNRGAAETLQFDEECRAFRGRARCCARCSSRNRKEDAMSMHDDDDAGDGALRDLIRAGTTRYKAPPALRTHLERALRQQDQPRRSHCSNAYGFSARYRNGRLVSIR